MVLGNVLLSLCVGGQQVSSSVRKKPLIINLHLMKRRLMQCGSSENQRSENRLLLSTSGQNSFPFHVPFERRLIFFSTSISSCLLLLSLIICEQSVAVPHLRNSFPSLADFLLFLSIFPLAVKTILFARLFITKFNYLKDWLTASLTRGNSTRK